MKKKKKKQNMSEYGIRTFNNQCDLTKSILRMNLEDCLERYMVTYFTSEGAGSYSFPIFCSY